MKKLHFVALFGVPLILLGCGGGGSGSNSSGGSSPAVSVTTVFLSSGYDVFSDKLDWSPDGRTIAFNGSVTTGTAGSSMDVFTVAAQAGATPVQVTDWTSQGFMNGGNTPAYLGDGTLTYFTGWWAGTEAMQLMAASTGQVLDVPAPTVLHAFNSSNLGQAANYSANPEPVTLSSDGSKGVYCWIASGASWGIYLLNWTSGATPVVTPLTGMTTCVLSKDGSYLAYVKTNGQVAFSPVGGAETILGEGSNPTWAQGNRLGYVTSAGYTIYTVGTGATKTWPATGTTFQNAAISWDATKVAFRTFSGTSTGVSFATLMN